MYQQMPLIEILNLSNESDRSTGLLTGNPDIN